MNWQIYIAAPARKQLKRLPQKDLVKISRAIDELETSPFAGDVEKLGDAKNIWRRRVGAYRLFYELNSDRKLIYLHAVKRRTTTTY